MDWKIELIPVPVSDVDRAKRFYNEQLGFVVDLDDQLTDTMRVVQLTPPGSACSIMVGTGTNGSTAGSLQGVQIVVSDIEHCSDQAGRAGRRVQSRPTLCRGWMGRRKGWPVELVRLLQRSRWQRLGPPGAPGELTAARLQTAPRRGITLVRRVP